MKTRLQQLRDFTNVVADTGDIEAIKKYQPEDATTNPSLILNASTLPIYSSLIDDAIDFAKKNSNVLDQQILNAGDKLAVNIGVKILEQIPGRISTEVDARLSFDTDACVNRAKKLISLYQDQGIDKSRILIKLASTWEGIKAAEILEKQGINCNLTLLFSFAQARACAEAGVFLISPFVGRIMDWYKAKEGREFPAQTDPGVLSVQKIYQYFKENSYKTIVMGASFRNVGEVLALAGCDKLTISPALLQELEASDDLVERKLSPSKPLNNDIKALTQSEFLWQHHQDAMAVEKLAEGIRNFAIDQEKLENMLREKLQN